MEALGGILLVDSESDVDLRVEVDDLFVESDDYFFGTIE